MRRYLAIPLLLAVPPALAATGVAATGVAATGVAETGVVGLRTGDHPGTVDHPGFGRVVLDLPPGTTAAVSRNGNAVGIRLMPSLPVELGKGAQSPRNVVGLSVETGEVRLFLAPGATLRRTLTAAQLIVDVLDRAAVPAAPAAQVQNNGSDGSDADARAERRYGAGDAARVASASSSADPAPSLSPSEPSRPVESMPEQAAGGGGVVPAQLPLVMPAPTMTQALSLPATPAATPLPQVTPSPQVSQALAMPLPPAAKPEAGPETPPAPTPSAEPPAPLMAPFMAAAPVPASTPASPPAQSPVPAWPAITLPFDAETGAAAFRRGDEAVIVFDQRGPADPAVPGDDPAFAHASIVPLPAATELRLPLGRDEVPVLTRSAEGWTVAIQPESVAPHPARIAVAAEDGALRLAAAAPGHVVSVPDPMTGAALLVGTLREAPRPVGSVVGSEAGTAQTLPRRSPEFAMPETWRGVLVEPVSDQMRLRATATGFLLAIDPPGRIALAVPDGSAGGPAAGRVFTRRFDFPALPVPDLLRRMQAMRAGTAGASVPERTARRLQLAEAMIALGLGPEAQALLALAGNEDGRSATDPTRLGLAAIAALVAGHPQDAASITDPALDGSDEIALWRAYRLALLHDDDAAAARDLASSVGVLVSYPEPLRRGMLGPVAEALVAGGQKDAARTLFAALPDGHGLDLARAMLAEADAKNGDIAPALAAYDKLAGGTDRRMRARAASRAIELRLAHGMMSREAAANALDRLLYAWRDEGYELGQRLRIAELRRDAGQWRPALALLRETFRFFPEQEAAVRPKLRGVLDAMLAADAVKPIPPLEFAAMAEENADLIPDGADGAPIASRLADRLASLDLPARAAMVLEKLAAAAPAGLPRAEIGARLALVRQGLGDNEAALDALNASAAPDLPPPLLETRTLAFARSAAALGDRGSAVEALTRLGTDAALALRAELLESARDWPAASAALRDLAGRMVPPEGSLTEGQAGILLRLATAAAQANDPALLASLRRQDLARFPRGRLADLFGVLTASPVQGVADLPRAAQETHLAGRLPQALNTLTR